MRLEDEEVLLFALKDQEVAEYHYRFYRVLATLDGGPMVGGAAERLFSLIREELERRSTAKWTKRAGT